MRKCSWSLAGFSLSLCWEDIEPSEPLASINIPKTRLIADYFFQTHLILKFYVLLNNLNISETFESNLTISDHYFFFWRASIADSTSL